MEFFSYLNDRTKHGLKTKIGMFLNKSDIWEEFIIEKQLDINKVNSYDRGIFSNAIFNKEKEYILKGLISEISDEDILKEISMYIDYILPRSCYVKIGNKKENYNGIKTIEGLSYFYEENNELDNKEYTGEDKVSSYKKEYFRYNIPYQKLSDKELHNLLEKDVYEADVYLRPEYQKPFNRLTMLKLLHYFYNKTEFEDVDKYICDRYDYYELLKDELIDPYIINKPVEIGDYVVSSGTKYLKEILYSDRTLGIGLVYNKHFKDDEFKVDFKSVGLGEWFYPEELKVINVTEKKELIEYIEDVFGEEDDADDDDYEIRDSDVFITKEEKVFAGISLFRNDFIKVKSPLRLEIYDEVVTVHIFNENDDYCFVQSNKTGEEYLIDKKANEVYEFDNRRSIDINQKQVAIVEDVLFNLNRLEPMLKNYYNDYSVFFESPVPSIKQLHLISKTLNQIYKEQLKDTKYKKLFRKFEPPFRDNLYNVTFNIPKCKKGFENYSYDEIKEIIEFLKVFNIKSTKHIKKIRELFILQ